MGPIRQRLALGRKKQRANCHTIKTALVTGVAAGVCLPTLHHFGAAEPIGDERARALFHCTKVNSTLKGYAELNGQSAWDCTGAVECIDSMSGRRR